MADSIERLADTITRAARDASLTEPRVRGGNWRIDEVTAVGAGTVTCGSIIARRLDSYLNPAVGDRILLSRSGSGNWATLGRVATTADTAWASYTPTWTAATTNPSLGNGTLIGRHHKIGRTVLVQINLIPGSTTTFGSGNYSFALPFTAADAGATYVGNAHLLAGDRWGGQFVISPANSAAQAFFPFGSGDCRIRAMSPTQPSTLASGHQLRITAVYESAT